jgi:hypothetical protein
MAYKQILVICMGAVAYCGGGFNERRRALLIGINNYGQPAGVKLLVPPDGHAPDSRLAPRALDIVATREDFHA